MALGVVRLPNLAAHVGMAVASILSQMATGLGPVERVILKTSLGEIAIELKTNEAPETCRTIKALVRGGHYDGCCIYRAEPGFGTEVVRVVGKLLPVHRFRSRTGRVAQT